MKSSAGHSRGALNALRYASLYDDIPRVISIAGSIVSGIRGFKMEPSEIEARLERDGKIEIKATQADGRVLTNSFSRKVDVKQSDKGM